MGYQIDLAGTPELSESGGVIVVKYSATNSGDSESGGTWDQAIVLHEGNHVFDSTEQVHSLQPGDSYDKHLEQLQNVHPGTYTVNLVLDSQGSANQAWSGEITVG